MPDLLSYLQLPIPASSDLPAVPFKTRVPRGFAQRMTKGDPQDPLLLQVLTQQAELTAVPGYEHDPLQELSTNPVAGLIHKYHGRVLLILTGACAIHCRYCFRRHFAYQQNQTQPNQFKEVIAYIATRPEIHEVILSGGDPLLYTDSKLEQLFAELSHLPQINTVRLHTRVPIVLPERVTPAFLTLLANAPFQMVMVLHSNHAQEFDHSVQQVCAQIKNSGAHLLNQSVLLKNINDDVDTLLALSHRLFACGILPYYLHLLDPVAVSAHFAVAQDKAQTLFAAMQQQLPGYLVPRLVKEKAGCLSKVWVNQPL